MYTCWSWKIIDKGIELQEVRLWRQLWLALHCKIQHSPSGEKVKKKLPRLRENVTISGSLGLNACAKKMGLKIEGEKKEKIRVRRFVALRPVNYNNSHVKAVDNERSTRSKYSSLDKTPRRWDWEAPESGYSVSMRKTNVPSHGNIWNFWKPERGREPVYASAKSW